MEKVDYVYIGIIAMIFLMGLKVTCMTLKTYLKYARICRKLKIKEGNSLNSTTELWLSDMVKRYKYACYTEIKGYEEIKHHVQLTLQKRMKQHDYEKHYIIKYNLLIFLIGIIGVLYNISLIETNIPSYKAIVIFPMLFALVVISFVLLMTFLFDFNRIKEKIETVLIDYLLFDINLELQYIVNRAESKTS